MTILLPSTLALETTMDDPTDAPSPASILDMVDVSPPAKPDREVVRDAIVAFLLTIEQDKGFSVQVLYDRFGGGFGKVAFKVGPFHAAREILLNEHHRVFTPRTRANGGRRGMLYRADPDRAEHRGDNFRRAGVKKIVRGRDHLKAASVTAAPTERPRIEKKIEKFEQNVRSGIHARIHQEMQPKFPTESKAPPGTPGKK